MTSGGLGKISSFVLTSIAAGLAAALVLLLVRPDLLDRKTNESASFHMGPPTEGQGPATGPYSYADAVAATAPSVVNIYAAKISTERQSLIFRDPVLQYLFGNLLPGQSRKRMETSLGSGVIVSDNGYVLTNYHVIEGADQIRAVVASGQEYGVNVIGADPDTDLAVLKIEAKQLPAVILGNSAEQRVGDVVLAIGNPFGVGQTVTMGIISATGRSDLGINTYENFIQTDAAINPGNSGGALINARGELIGINTAIFSKSGGYQGIGFAIPVNLAGGVMKQLVDHGRVVRGWLGISGQNVTKELAESFGLPQVGGVLVSGTLEGGPAAEAGIHPGDVITRVNGQAIDSINEVLDTVSNAGPGAKLKIDIWRGNDSKTLYATTAERPATSGER